MAFRSHLTRSLDLKVRSNLLIVVLVASEAAIGMVLWLGGETGEILWAPVVGFTIWALLREIDPDHDWTALAGAAMAGAWLISGRPFMSVLAAVGLLMTARITTATTGRRPLPSDLAGAAVLGIVIGFTVEGWAAGFGIALAIYLDDRFRGEGRLAAVAASALTAIGTTVVATVTGAFPERLPDVVEYLAVAAGIVALILFVRDPATPTTQVDARHSAFLDKARLHLSRSVIGFLVFLMTILVGAAADEMVALIAALGLVVVSNELELLRRRRE